MTKLLAAAALAGLALSVSGATTPPPAPEAAPVSHYQFKSRLPEKHRQQLRDLTRILSPFMTKVDYDYLYGNSLTPEQVRMLDRVTSSAPLGTTRKEMVARINAELDDMMDRIQSRPAITPELETYLGQTATMAEIAYCADKPETFDSFNCGKRCEEAKRAGVVPFRAFASENNYGYAAVAEPLKAVIIAFRGSSNAANDQDNRDFGKTNWRFSPLPRPTPQLHSGFAKSYDEIRAKVLKGIEDLRKAYPDFTYIFTGHSLGGAIANQAAVDAVAGNLIPGSQVRLVPFGAPRVGNADFAGVTDRIGMSSVLRYTQDNDLVVSLPPTWLDFRHHSGEIHARGANAVVCRGQEDNTCLAGQGPFFTADVHGFLFGKPFFGKDQC